MRPLAIAGLLIAGCGGTPITKTVVEIVPVVARPTAAPRSMTADRAADASACSLAWDPRRLGSSVVAIPPEAASRMMSPVLAALCACTKPGSQHSIVVDLEPRRGRAEAHSSDSDAGLDGCLEPRLGDAVYPAIDIESDCVDCGPKRYGVFGGPPPPAEAPRGVRLRMPFQVDRRGER